MDKLFSDSETFTKERPTKPTEQQLQDLYLKIALEISIDKYSNSDIEDIVKDIEGLYPFHDTGYEMAKDLERGKARYRIDSNFIELLESVDYEIHSIKGKNEIEWVKAHNIKPNFNVNDVLIAQNDLKGTFDMKKYDILYIHRIDIERGRYIVKKDIATQGGTLLTYENIEANCIIKKY